MPNDNSPNRPALADPMDGYGDAGALATMESGYGSGSMMPVPEGHQSASLAGLGMVMSLPVVRPRNHQALMQNLKQLCAANGQRYVYSWEVRNRARGTRDTIEGPTIKLANDLARTYGNCFAGIADVRDTGQYWEFIALFLDRETGFAMARSFQQRKQQDTGMKDAERQRDIVYQIGASKAIRNVVTNALQSYVEFMVEEAKRGLIDWVQRNGSKAGEYIDGACERHKVDIKRVESFVGRPRDQWVNRDVASVMMRLRSIDEGQASADDVFPSPEDVDAINAETEARTRKETRARQKVADDSGDDSGEAKGSGDAKAETKPRAAARKAEPAKGKKAEAKKPDPEPEPEPEPETAEHVDPDTGEVTEAATEEPEPEPEQDDDDDGWPGPDTEAQDEGNGGGRGRLDFGDE